MEFGGITDSRFEVHGLLGEGGCGAVYHAFDRLTSSWIALKVLTDREPNAHARFEREARAACSINHPNVCAAYGHGELDDGRSFVTMELLEGVNLRDYLDKRGGLGVEAAIEITVQILSGLDVAHAMGLVHRDVKPENVFLVRGSDGRVTVKLLDFGLCRSAADTFDGKTLTAEGSFVGTPGYLAPEQIAGERVIDARVDIFTAGLVLFELLTGRRAYRGKNVVQLIASLMAYPVPSVRKIMPSVPAVLDRVLQCATQHDRTQRYQSAAHFLHDLLSARTAIRVAASPRADRNRVPTLRQPASSSALR